MDYRYLKAFLATAKHQSFTLAAKELRISQSAISRQVKLLEEEIKEDLFLRSSGTVQLTQKGLEFFRCCQHFEQNWENIFQGNQIKNIRIGILQGILDNWFHHIIGSYYEKFHHNLNIHVGGVTEIRKMLFEGQLDLAFLTQNIQTEAFTSLSLFPEKFLLIGKEEINRHELHLYRWIVYNEDDHLWKLTKKRSKQVIVVNSMESILELVNKGVGIAVIPEHVYEGKRKIGAKIHHYPLPIKEESFIYLVMPNFKVLPLFLQDMITLIKSSFKSNKFKMKEDRGDKAVPS